MITPLSSRCISCNYPHFQKDSDGSEFDFLCAVYFNKIVGLFPFIRTFRQCNKKSPIIILINEFGFKNMKQLDKAALYNCGVTLLNLGKVKTHISGFQIVRLIYFYNFLSSSKLYFKRCIFTDGFDVIFQGDPFTTELKEDKIYLTIENETNNFIRKLYKPKFPDSYDIICNHNIINCGVFAGGTSIIYYFFSFYLKMFPGIMAIESQTINYQNPYSDQDALNYFIYVYLPENNNHFLQNNVVLLDSRSMFSSMIGEVRYKIPNISWNFPNFSFYSKGKVEKPLLIHQYTYSTVLSESLVRVCGLLDHQNSVTDYYRLKTRK